MPPFKNPSLTTNARSTALNLLTSSVVREASNEIRSGRHVQLDWPLESIQKPRFDRRPMHHMVINNYARLQEYALDDEIEMNTQTGSHWDSLRHVSVTFSTTSTSIAVSSHTTMYAYSIPRDVS